MAQLVEHQLPKYWVPAWQIRFLAYMPWEYVSNPVLVLGMRTKKRTRQFPPTSSLSINNCSGLKINNSSFKPLALPSGHGSPYLFQSIGSHDQWWLQFSAASPCPSHPTLPRCGRFGLLQSYLSLFLNNQINSHFLQHHFYNSFPNAVPPSCKRSRINSWSYIMFTLKKTKKQGTPIIIMAVDLPL